MGQGEQSIRRPGPPLLAYFRHSGPESGASDSTTRRLTDSKSSGETEVFIAACSGQHLIGAVPDMPLFIGSFRPPDLSIDIIRNLSLP